jgi:hypothetical protein
VFLHQALRLLLVLLFQFLRLSIIHFMQMLRVLLLLKLLPILGPLRGTQQGRQRQSGDGDGTIHYCLEEAGGWKLEGGAGRGRE